MNNTGLQRLGEIGHPQIDSVTFERGHTFPTDTTGRYRTGEMSQVLNDHWGVAMPDINYKSVTSLIENLVECRMNKCNFNLNIGPMPNGEVRLIDRGIFELIGIWVKKNKNFIYDVHGGKEISKDCLLLEAGEQRYLYIKEVQMSSDTNVAYGANDRYVDLPAELGIKKGVWLDDNSKAEIKKGKLKVKPFGYGTSLTGRVLKIKD